ncbi:hypothetical protein EDB83DRAFT_1933570 [Lactarius deliciosus]|nr:hypothetical protein EDB83DRAFT_1933570 [Lactarius deliciosus]
MRDPPPPLGVKLTCYRLLNVTTGIFFVSLTAVLAYKNLTGAATTVGLLSGLSTLGLYCVGLYERRSERNWFFQDDLVPIFVRGGEPCFLYGVGIDANEQTRSYMGSVLSLRRACLSSIHLHPFTWCLLPYGPLFARLGDGHRQYWSHVPRRGHPYGFGCWGHLEAQIVTYSIFSTHWNWESDLK